MTRRISGLLLCGLWAPLAYSLPMLQLDIDSGVYVGGDEESVLTSSNVFELYALGNTTSNKFDSNDLFHISAALTPKTQQPGGDFGSFNVSYTGWNEADGQSFVVTDQVVQVTADMTFGIPPLEANWDHDGGDLGSHDIYNTYYYQMSFKFSGSNTATPYNVQNAGGGGLDKTSSGSLWFETFTFDLSSLSTEYDLHFDLYHDEVSKRDLGDLDVEYFAPFSKDAGTTNRTTSVPSPGGPAIIIAGLALLTLSLRAKGSHA